jgi:hypothetical protein
MEWVVKVGRNLLLESVLGLCWREGLGERESLLQFAKHKAWKRIMLTKKKLGKEKHTWMYHNILKESAV